MFLNYRWMSPEELDEEIKKVNKEREYGKKLSKKIYDKIYETKVIINRLKMEKVYEA